MAEDFLEEKNLTKFNEKSFIEVMYSTNTAIFYPAK
jgi:hypothetical protein